MGKKMTRDGKATIVTDGKTTKIIKDGKTTTLRGIGNISGDVGTVIVGSDKPINTGNGNQYYN